MILRPGVAPDGTIHASAVAFGTGPAVRAAVLVGPSGSGKSALALGLLAIGGRLVGDDRLRLERIGNVLNARPVAALRGVIEARGLGLLRADAVSRAQVSLVVDMASGATDRLPVQGWAELLGVRITCVQNVAMSHFPAALRQYLVDGCVDPENWP